MSEAPQPEGVWELKSSRDFRLSFICLTSWALISDLWLGRACQHFSRGSRSSWSLTFIAAGDIPLLWGENERVRHGFPGAERRQNQLVSDVSAQTRPLASFLNPWKYPASENWWKWKFFLDLSLNWRLQNDKLGRWAGNATQGSEKKRDLVEVLLIIKL